MIAPILSLIPALDPDFPSAARQVRARPQRVRCAAPAQLRCRERLDRDQARLRVELAGDEDALRGEGFRPMLVAEAIDGLAVEQDVLGAVSGDACLRAFGPLRMCWGRCSAHLPTVITPVNVGWARTADRAEPQIANMETTRPASRAAAARAGRPVRFSSQPSRVHRHGRRQYIPVASSRVESRRQPSWLNNWLRQGL